MKYFLNYKFYKFILLFLSAILVYTNIEADLHIELKSNVSGQTQFFYPSENGIFLENDSFESQLIVGITKLHIPLHSVSHFIRWDPVNGPGEFIITSIFVSLPFVNISLNSNTITANSQIAKLVKQAGGLLVTTVENAKDPSVKIKLPWQKIANLKLCITVFIIFIFYLIVSLILILLRYLGKFQTEIVTIIKDEFNADTLNKLFILILFSCGFWIVSLTSYSISIDDEFSAFRQDQSVWISQGRWTIYLINRFIMSQPVIPFLPHLILCLSIVISYFLILRAHRLKLEWKSIYIFPVFMAFPTWYFIAEFYANLLAVSFGLILCSISLLIFSRLISRRWQSLDKKTFFMFFYIQAVLLSISIGAYQSYLLAYISMGLGILVLKLKQEPRISLIIIYNHLFHLFFVTFSSFILYQVISLLFQAGLKIETTYIDSFFNPQIIVNQPWEVIGSTFMEAIHIYAGSSDIYGVSICASGILLLLGLVSLNYTLHDWKQKVIAFVMILGCISTPFLLNLLAGGAMRIPYRSFIGIPYIIWFFAMLVTFSDIAKINKIALMIISVLIFQLANAHSTYNAATQLSLEHDKVLAAKIYYRLVESLPDDKLLSDYKIDFYGAKPFKSIFPYVPTSTIGHSFFDWDGGNPLRIVSFMQLIGYYDVSVINCDERNALIKYYKEMPTWPSKGAVRLVGNVFLVKMGSKPGLVHINCLE